jgi:hypothetical protein
MQFVTPNFLTPLTSDLTLFSSSHDRPPFTVTLFPHLPHLFSCAQDVHFQNYGAVFWKTASRISVSSALPFVRCFGQMSIKRISDYSSIVRKGETGFNWDQKQEVPPNGYHATTCPISPNSPFRYVTLRIVQFPSKKRSATIKLSIY